MSFSTAELAVVAYALVKADGTSGEINSGVGTTYLSGPNAYNIILPGSENVAVTEQLQQGQGDPKTGNRKDLIFVTPIGPDPGWVSTKDVSEFVKQIKIVLLSEAVRTDFAVVILRPVVPTPTDAAGNQNGPE